MESLISTVNVRGLSNKNKRLHIFEWLKGLNHSIYMLQETHLSKDNFEKWKQDWPGKFVYSGNKTNSEGVGIFIHPKSNIEIIQSTEIIEGRLLSADIKIQNKIITLINVYGPNSDDITLFNNLQNYLLKHNEKSYIVGGDFNTVLNTNIDKKNGSNKTHSKCRNILLNIISTCELTDIWRTKHPEKLQYTWHSNTKPPIHCRLDYFLISENLCNLINICSIKPGYKTDHSLVYLSINESLLGKGPGYFKLNNSILLDIEYQEKIQLSINDVVTATPD